ncbi:MAG: chemotaxis protein CheW [Bacteroidota bacterium]
MTETKNENSITSYLSFRLGDEIFATDVGKVLEILELSTITRVPKAPDYMRGVINLRGKVLPVLDTRVKFGLEVTDDNVDTCIVVLDVIMDGDTLHLGALVDSVEEVLKLSAGDIEPPPSLGNRFNAEYLKGMVKQNDTFIMILDADRVFNSSELIMAKESSDNIVSA